ncbi:arylsulfatase B-like isoform X2 [Uranotaenia lowii]|uniref:arylsulfatase B-like isoform X2 n=1 Tax=Uranotaenia lowii TaxID=190385 RepID=UPI0024791075|nr:arylsulfatase B-like isoform X2 [Uranotaenia lowii]
MHRTGQNHRIAGVLLLLLGTLCSGNLYQQHERPHIVIIMADDLGWNDVGFHGSNQIPTPNIDALAYDGIILNRHYTAPMCTPSRAAMMTGRNPVNVGMQHYVIDTDEPWGLGLDQKIMPEYFKEAGYRTHLVGKWHLGFFAQQYTPLRRGFDSHVGYYAPYIDYWDYTNKMNDPEKKYVGYDLRNNWDIDLDANGTYATDHFTNAASKIIAQHNEKDPLFLMVNHLAPHAGNDDYPMQAPQATIDKFGYIADENRRIYAAMMSKLDDSVGEIFKALRAKKMLKNTIILFLSDNGAPSVGLHANYGSNSPLRGQKNSPWEGATRNVAAIWSPLIQERQRVSNQFVHISDWLPTLAAAAGIHLPHLKNQSEIDGIDQWEALSYDTGNPRRAVLNMIDEEAGYSSYMENGLKYVNGTTVDGAFDDWFGVLPTTDKIPSDDEYFKKIVESEVGSQSPVGLTKDSMKYLRKHAVISCKTPLNPTSCDPRVRACLFDIINDPCERNDISAREPYKFRELRAKVERYRRAAAKPRNKPADPAANPANFGGVWNWWRRDQPCKHGNNIVSHEGLEIPPPHSSLPEDIQLTVSEGKTGIWGYHYWQPFRVPSPCRSA